MIPQIKDFKMYVWFFLQQGLGFIGNVLFEEGTAVNRCTQYFGVFFILIHDCVIEVTIVQNLVRNPVSLGANGFVFVGYTLGELCLESISVSQKPWNLLKQFLHGILLLQIVILKFTNFRC